MHRPELFEEGRAKLWATLAILPSTVLLVLRLFTHGSENSGGAHSGEFWKALLVLSFVFGVLALVWKGVLQNVRFRAFAANAALPFRLLSLFGLAIFACFELSGFWPPAQVTGELHFSFLIPGACILTAWAMLAWEHRSAPEFRLYQDWFLITVLFTALSALKLTSTKYWTLSLLIWACWMIAALHQASPKAKSRASTLFALGSLLNGLLMAAFYFRPILNNGATQNEFKFAWIKDRALYYRPIVRVYDQLDRDFHFCNQDRIHVDHGVNSIVLDVHRRMNAVPCEEGHRPRTLYIGAEAWAGAIPGLHEIARSAEWGDFAVYEPEITSKAGR